jgi:hypothetical protein
MILEMLLSCFQHRHSGPENGDSRLLRNVGIYLRVYMESQPRTISLTSLPENPQISLLHSISAILYRRETWSLTVREN